ncbi:MAG: hypothetical protein V7731_18890 [Amphritea sp.]
MSYHLQGTEEVLSISVIGLSRQICVAEYAAVDAGSVSVTDKSASSL